MKLRLGPDLAVPDDAVTQTFVVFGKRGSGKSNTGVVLAEEIHRAGGQIIVLDPIGAWWGLKASFDGSAVGLPVYVFGGTHGDLPLSSTAGQLMAQVAISHRIPMVLDMTGWSGAERARFVTAFARWLLEHNDRVPVHVFLEEADAFIPQRPYKGEEDMLGAMDRLIRWGRAAGIGATAITQRSAKINKDVTTQAEVLIAHRTIGPQDVAAIKAWIQYHASGDEQQTVLSTLPTLPDGTAWVWSPDWLGMLRQVAFRRRETFDSASTPKLGEKRAQPKEMAPVDVDRLRDQLADTIEKAKADDPAVLRKRIAELEGFHVESERQLKAAWDAAAQVEPIVERVEVPVLNGQVVELRLAIGELVDAGQRLVEVATAIGDAAAVIQTTGKGIGDALGLAQQTWQGRPLDRVAAAPRTGQEHVQQAPVPPARVVPASPGASLAAAGLRPTAPGDAPPYPSKAEHAILSAVTSYPIGLTREQLAFLADYHPRSKGFTNALGTLRSRGLITPGFPAEATDAGRTVVSGVLGYVEPPVAPGDLAILWLARFGRAEAAILRTVIDLYPQDASREELAAAAGFEHVRSKGFTNALGRLRGLGLVDGMGLHADFARLLGR